MNPLDNDLDNEFDLDDMDFDLINDVNDISDAPPSSSAKKAKSLSFLNDIPVHVTVEVGAKTVTLKELLEIKNDSVLMLTKENGKALDIKVNGKLFAYGEVVVANGHYGVKITDIVNKDID
ncbi:surface presentation of antigens (SPOA) protein [Psychromonas ingrahamii 37]|uniref:Flagellar motor switch protein FliN n=1 Tax=Psychromonas ingrahamii (strain DSM 17664 / CCUG 51855 / 37) TaxID=357804 RepID=A1T0L0_PSYIN|nr:flagellar motor switch protein FliN [Psychromonas ingrahamii]ABM05275.1 surface presentation of antigens (SPOA) protein [Psychromonas ingrahamii 37]